MFLAVLIVAAKYLNGALRSFFSLARERRIDDLFAWGG